MESRSPNIYVVYICVKFPPSVEFSYVLEFYETKIRQLIAQQNHWHHKHTAESMWWGVSEGFL